MGNQNERHAKTLMSQPDVYSSRIPTGYLPIDIQKPKMLVPTGCRWVKVQEINKRTLGKLILKAVGNEGTTNDKEEAVLRRQVQTCISNIEHYKPAVWVNSRVTFLSLDGHEYVIESGSGYNRFMVHLDAEDEIAFVKLK